MGKPPSQVAAQWVKQDLNSENWVLLRELLFSVVKRRVTTWSDEETWDYVETNLPYVAEDLRDAASEWMIDGTVAAFEIDSDPSPYIRYLSVVPSGIVAKLRRIDPFELEAVCARMLSALGADSQITPKTNDGGVDFIAVNLKIVPTAFSVPVACKAAVIGQAKRYKDGSQISETRLREFVGSATLVKHELCASGQIGPLAPVLFAFWTTSDFDPNAKRYARKMGLWYMDGLTMAAYVENLGLSDWVLALSDVATSSIIPSKIVDIEKVAVVDEGTDV